MIALVRPLLLAICLVTCANSTVAQQSDSERSAKSNADLSKTSAGVPDSNSRGGKRGGWVIAIFIGASHTASSPLTISQPALGTNVTFQDVQFRSQSFKNLPYFGLRGGYFLRRVPWLGLELEYIHIKVISNAQQDIRATGTYHGAAINQSLTLGQIVQRYSISHGVNLTLFNFAARHALGRTVDHDGRVIVSARAGLGLTVPHTESTVDNHSQEQFQAGRFVWQLSGGAEVRVWRRLYALAEYKFTRTRQRGRIFSGTAESLLRSQHAAFGLSYHFHSTPRVQPKSSGPTNTSPDGEPRKDGPFRSRRFELFTGYNYLHASHDAVSNLSGWKASIGFRSNSWLSLRVEATGGYGKNGGDILHRHGLFVGPQFTVYSNNKLKAFLIAQVGAIHDSCYHTTRASGEVRSVARSSVLEFGGGFDVHLAKQFSYRIEFLPNLKPKDWQNDARITSGVVFHFGRRKT